VERVHAASIGYFKRRVNRNEGIRNSSQPILTMTNGQLVLVSPAQTMKTDRKETQSTLTRYKRHLMSAFDFALLYRQTQRGRYEKGL